MEMTPDKWEKVKVLFEAALDRPPDCRLQFLEDSCSDDHLRAEVARLLAEYESAGSFLSKNDVERLLASENSTLTGPLDNSAHKIGTELVPSQTLAQYQIEEKLGQGGMGAVYRAHDTRLLRTVALKVLAPKHIANAEKRKRLMLEARAASVLNHSNIVTVYEIGSDLDVDFIAMEYVQGQSLAYRIPQEGLPLGRALDYAAQIAGALAKAHSEGVIHRDLKPANVMLTSDDRVKLLDFGIAQRSSIAEPHSSLSAESEICGTIGYMSPEQVRGLPINCRTDLFSFGVVLYEMVTGKRPFTGSSATVVLDATLHAEPRGFNDRQLPGKLKAMILKLLEKDPANRYESAEEVQRELKSLESALAPVEPVKLSRNAWIAVGCATLLIVILAGWLWHRTSRQRWALETAAPEITRLVDAEEYIKAASLAKEALRVLPNDPTLERLWIRATGEVSIASEPSGAKVSMRPYRGDTNAWESVGKTPLRKIRLPQGDYIWRIVKPGFAPIFFIDSPAGIPPPGAHSEFDYTLRFRPAASVPPGMVVVPGGWVSLTYPLNARGVEIDDFLIDRNEVTNKEYKTFVDAGGYQQGKFWKQPFVRDGRIITWQEALPLFRDATGRPGPATWEQGDYPKGYDKYPVAGISWYEAAAYAEFAGKSLPTAYHWMLASQATDYTGLIAPGSNFRPDGTQPIGSDTALSGFGTTDMAGNVKEWTLNEKPDGKRFIMGGGFGEPSYTFYLTDAQSPWDRRPNFGFRCAKLDSPPKSEAFRHL